MPRPKGSSNADFAITRSDLLNTLREALLGDSPPTSLRSLAAAAAVSVPTLRHYFGDKDAVLAAVFSDCHDGGARELLTAATPSGAFPISVRDLAVHVADGFRFGRLDRLHSIGLTEGLAEPRVAYAYLTDILEPTIEAAQTRLQHHIDSGEMRATCPRHAALALLAPIVLLFVHQNGLNGATTHPAKIDEFLTDHVDAFVRGYEGTSASKTSRNRSPR